MLNIEKIYKTALMLERLKETGAAFLLLTENVSMAMITHIPIFFSCEAFAVVPVHAATIQMIACQSKNIYCKVMICLTGGTYSMSELLLWKLNLTNQNEVRVVLLMCDVQKKTIQ